MAFTIHYLDVVKTDIKEAKVWYKNQKVGLDKYFALEVKKCIFRLQKNPLGYEVKYKNVRTAFTEVFPYAVHFYIDEDAQHVVIIAIIHQRRNPSLPYNRSDEM
ncbi:plasmid stabilization system [Inquilinus sp. KBS0705]|nr:plasmid stabilization system [Inquilinus sp. KBS0705]